MNILVNGGLGFLGGRVSQYLRGAGHNVVIGSSRESVVESERSVNHIQILHTPLDGLGKLSEACKGMDVVIQASGMDAATSVQNPTDAYYVNTIATANLLSSAVKEGVKCFIYFSSIHVYTNDLAGEISDADCVNNVHPYASSHRSAEDVVLWGRQQGLIDGIVLRLSNGFGKPADLTANCWKLLVNDLCRQAVEKNILKLNSSGQQERNFLPISEILNVIDFLINNIQETSMTGRPCPINVGGRRSYSVYEMAKLIRKRCQLVIGADPDIRVPNSKLGDSNRRSLDYKSEKLLELGFRYSVSVEDEIDDLLWYCFKQFGKNSG